MTTTNLIAFVGSLRSGSVNAATARAASELAPVGVSITIHSIDEIPMFNEDIEKSGVPASVTELNAAVATADGLLFFSPEYNTSVPAVLKNVIDWLSRDGDALKDKPVASVATTPGSRAGQGVLSHLDSIFDNMLAEVRRHESFGIGSYFEKFNEVPELHDEQTRSDLAEWLAGFVEFVNQ